MGGVGGGGKRYFGMCVGGEGGVLRNGGAKQGRLSTFRLSPATAILDPVTSSETQRTTSVPGKGSMQVPL